jgi:hypothetical protein
MPLFIDQHSFKINLISEVCIKFLVYKKKDKRVEIYMI